MPTKIKEKIEKLYDKKSFNGIIKDANIGIALRKDIKPIVTTVNPIVTYTNTNVISIKIEGKEFLIQKQENIIDIPEDFIYCSIHVLEKNKDTYEYKYKRMNNKEFAIAFNITNPNDNRFKVPKGEIAKEKYNEMMINIIEEIVKYLDDKTKNQKCKKEETQQKSNTQSNTIK